MHGGVIFESSTHTPLPSAPVLKQELITEHYAITAKRPSHKDKMQRPPNINTSLASDAQSTYNLNMGPAPFPGYVVGPHPSGFYQPTGGQQQYAYPPQPVPGPSRQASHSADSQAPPASASTGHTAQRSWDAVSTASASSHKRKRSSSSQPTELRTPRKASHQSLPGSTKGLLPGIPGSAGGQSQLPTPPSTGDYVATPTQPGQASPDHYPAPSRPEKKRSGVYVTNTDEGRKLGLVRTSNGSEDVEKAPERGPPRTKTATVLSVNAAGVATVGSGNVLQTDPSIMDPPKTPTQNRHIPDTDTPRTKDDKVQRRLSAFKTTSRPAEPMYSIRLDMGQGGPTRVALRKDIALAFIGMDKATQVVEERRRDDEMWAASKSGGREPVRPDWPDEEAPWKNGGGRRAKQLREDRERNALLRRYLESSSDDDEDHDAAARVPIPTRRHKSNPSTDSNPPPPVSDDPTDARAALWFAMRKARRGPVQLAPPQMVPTGVISCVCKNTAPTGHMISCTSCKSWHHLACVGIDDVGPVPNWVCDPCVSQARRATLSTPSQRTPPQFSTNERSLSAFRGNQAIALAPSPMFAGDAARTGGSGDMTTRTPYTPSRRRERARVLSYDNEWGITGEDPSTPVRPSRASGDRFMTPRIDDPVFDVNSTPSRHLSTDPRMAGQFAGSLFAITPLIGRSRNPSNPLVPGETPMGSIHRGGRSISGMPPYTEGVANRHEFLQGLTADRDRRDGPETPLGRRGLGHPMSPSPFNAGGHRRTPSVNKFSHLRSSSTSRSGLGLGLPIDEDPADE